MPPVSASLRLFPFFRGVLLVGALLASTGFAATAQASTASRAETLNAIHHVENPLNSTRPGKFGELGAYQFRRGTWRMHTDVPFERALDRVQSEEVAIRHYEWLRRGLARNGFPQTPYYIALAWNGGLSSVIRNRSSRAARDYAERVNNLVVDLKTNRLAIAP
jgi:hypothetical protein